MYVQLLSRGARKAEEKVFGSLCFGAGAQYNLIVSGTDVLFLVQRV